MNLTWAILGLITCAFTPEEWGLSSATLLLTSFSHTAFAALMAYLEPRLLGSRKAGDNSKAN